LAIRTKNIYDPASPEDGLRLLVMRYSAEVSRQQELLAALLGLGVLALIFAAHRRMKER